MKFIILLVLVGVVTNDSSFEWDNFKRDYNKRYASPAEEAQRRQIFIDNVNRIRVYQQTHPDATFTMAINHLADRRIEEFVSGPIIHFESLPASIKSSIQMKNLPEELDWRTQGVISPVHDQGLETDIIGIVSTEVVETLNAIRTKKLVEGSIARTHDCCPQLVDPFDCIMNLSGICRKIDYPVALGRCEANRCTPFATFDKVNRLNEGDETTMLTWIQDSTLYAGIYAAQSGFQFYTNGVYDDPECPKEIDHVLQIVGYGTEDGKPFWMCKNSWGVTWGDQGYIRIVRDKNMCGIANVVMQVAAIPPTPSSSTPSSTPRRLFTISQIPLMLLFVCLVSRLSTINN